MKTQGFTMDDIDSERPTTLKRSTNLTLETIEESPYIDEDDESSHLTSSTDISEYRCRLDSGKTMRDLCEDSECQSPLSKPSYNKVKNSPQLRNVERIHFTYVPEYYSRLYSEKTIEDLYEEFESRSSISKFDGDKVKISPQLRNVKKMIREENAYKIGEGLLFYDYPQDNPVGNSKIN